VCVCLCERERERGMLRQSTAFVLCGTAVIDPTTVQCQSDSLQREHVCAFVCERGILKRISALVLCGMAVIYPTTISCQRDVPRVRECVCVCV